MERIQLRIYHIYHSFSQAMEFNSGQVFWVLRVIHAAKYQDSPGGPKMSKVQKSKHRVSMRSLWDSLSLVTRQEMLYLKAVTTFPTWVFQKRSIGRFSDNYLDDSWCIFYHISFGHCMHLGVNDRFVIDALSATSRNRWRIPSSVSS